MLTLALLLSKSRVSSSLTINKIKNQDFFILYNTVYHLNYLFTVKRTHNVKAPKTTDKSFLPDIAFYNNAGEFSVIKKILF